MSRPKIERPTYPTVHRDPTIDFLILLYNLKIAQDYCATWASELDATMYAEAMAEWEFEQERLSKKHC